MTVTYDCAYAEDGIQTINDRIEELSSELQDASSGSQKSIIASQIDKEEEKRDRIEQDCGL